jgi:hypothetical protein
MLPEKKEVTITELLPNRALIGQSLKQRSTALIKYLEGLQDEEIIALRDYF